MPHSKHVFTEEIIEGVSLELKATRPSPLSSELPFTLLIAVYGTYWLLFALIWDAVLSTTHIVVLLFQIISILYLHSYVVAESLLVVKDLGFQLKIVTFLGKETLTFYPTDDIGGILIHEYILGSSVCMSFAFILTRQDRLVIAFKDVQPGLEAVKYCFNRCCELEPRFAPNASSIAS